MTKKTAAINASPLSASGVAVMLQGAGITLSPCGGDGHGQRDSEVKLIAKVLQSELGPSAPRRMIEESARSYYEVLCAVTSSRSFSAKTKPAKG